MTEDFQEEDFRLNNRQKSKTASKQAFWCACDYYWGGEYGKCPVCGGHTNKIKYDRKSSSFNA